MESSKKESAIGAAQKRRVSTCRKQIAEEEKQLKLLRLKNEEQLKSLRLKHEERLKLSQLRLKYLRYKLDTLENRRGK